MTIPRARSFAPSAFATVCFSLVVASVACSSAPEETAEQGSEALFIKMAPCEEGWARQCTNGLCSAACTPMYLTSKAGAPDTSASDTHCALVTSTPLAVPPELTGLGCTLGYQYFPDTWYLDHDDVSGDIWACPAGITPPAKAGGVFAIEDTTFSSRCLGSPDPGWVFITQDIPSSNQACAGGCPGAPPPPHFY